MRIGELSTRTGVSRRSLRYYEEQGLLDSSRAASGQRHYEGDHVRRVTLIQAFFGAGMSSRSIREVLACIATTRPEASVAEHASQVMARERARITGAIDELCATRIALEELITINQEYLGRQDDRSPDGSAGTGR